MKTFRSGTDIARKLLDVFSDTSATIDTANDWKVSNIIKFSWYSFMQLQKKVQGG